MTLPYTKGIRGHTITAVNDKEAYMIGGEHNFVEKANAIFKLTLQDIKELY